MKNNRLYNYICTYNPRYSNNRWQFNNTRTLRFDSHSILFHAIIRDSFGEFTILVYEKTEQVSWREYHEPYKCNIILYRYTYYIAISWYLEVTYAATRSCTSKLLWRNVFCAYIYFISEYDLYSPTNFK